jgi:opacity protein-like surface antigen
MKKFHIGAVAASALIMGLTAQAANAQSATFHADADVGYTSFHAAGDKDSHVGWGAAVGADFDMGGFFLGGEGTFWNARPEVNTIDGAGIVHHKQFQEWGLGLRAGASLAPGTRVYGKVAYVKNEQRKEFVPYTAGGGIGGASTPGYYYDHGNTHGIQYGAGVEQSIMNNFYVKAEGRYSDYKNHTHALTGLIGLGVAFGGPAPAPIVEAAPPPPPPVEAPATQTCPDGSVILATSTCPVPPPPPPAPVQRGQRG